MALSATLAASSSPSSRRHHALVRVTSAVTRGLVVETCSASSNANWNWPRLAAAVEASAATASATSSRTSVAPLGGEISVTFKRLDQERVLWNSVAMTNWRYWAAPVSSVMTGSSSVAAASSWRSAMIRALAYASPIVARDHTRNPRYIGAMTTADNSPSVRPTRRVSLYSASEC